MLKSTLFLLGTDWQWKRLNILQRMGPEEGVKVLNEIFSLKKWFILFVNYVFSPATFQMQHPYPHP